MRVPQGDHKDFMFMGISSTSRQDLEQLGSSIDCIFPFFMKEAGDYAHSSRGKSAAPGQLSPGTSYDDSTT